MKIVSMLLFLFVAPASQTYAQIKHLGITDNDRFFLCAREVFGKPVLGYFASVSCPDTPQSLLKSLQQNGVLTLEQSDFIYLVPSTAFLPNSGVKWRHVSISLETRDSFAANPVCRQLTHAEIDHISHSVLREVRLVEISVVHKAPEPESDTVSAKLIISMGACHLKPGVESLVGQFASAGYRLFYGELKDGNAKILWDSPPVEGWIEQLQDMDGDGIPEILVTSRSGRQNAECLSVYDIGGNDLTENADPDGAGCIIGLENKFEKRVDGKVDILAWSPNEASAEGHPYRYTLINGHYTRQKPASTPERTKPAPYTPEAVNEEGMQLMKGKNYQAAAAKFEEAFHLNPSSVSTKALVANNAGFAYYKMDRYDESVFWFKKAIESDPNRAVAYLNLGDAYVKLSHNADARRAYTKYLELAPNSKAASDVKIKLAALPTTP